jgi:hypothetical protein
MPDIGKSAVAGLISGIESMMPSLKNTASEIASLVRSIIQGVSSVGNVSSPTSNKSSTSTNKSGTASTMNGGIEWFAKGGIFDKASIVGLAENGKEAIVPISNQNHMAPFADAVFDRLMGNFSRKTVNNTSSSQQDITLHNTFHFDVKTDLDEKGMRRVAEFVSKQQINTLKNWGRI